MAIKIAQWSGMRAIVGSNSCLFYARIAKVAGTADALLNAAGYVGLRIERLGEANLLHRLQLPVHAFLCHASEDKSIIRDLYRRLHEDGIVPWFDEEDLLPGQEWSEEIPNAVRRCDVALICLSAKAVNKRGYIQKEIRYVLDVADEQPFGTIFLIPVRLEECEVPERLRKWQWVDLFESRGYERLLNSLRQVSQARTHILPATSGDAGDAGDAGTIGDAVVGASGGRPSASTTSASDGGRHPFQYLWSLTRREIQVLGLLAEGLTDLQIAEQLFLSFNTVHTHLRSIYAKLGVTTRGAAARKASEQGLT